MIKHIVLFKLKDTLSSSEKEDVMSRFKSAIEALPDKIEIIRSIHVGFNCNPAEQWDIVLNSEFDTMEDLSIYASHPEHIAAGSIIKDAKADRACVDYEF